MEQIVAQEIEKAEIMVVEDERIIARDIKRCLQDFGYDVPTVVSSGEEALQKVQQHGPDLVLMDIVLDGEIDGIETARQIHDNYDIPIIYLTAYTDEDMLKRAKKAEPFGYILKPFGDRELYSSIEMALYKHREEKKLKMSEKLLSYALKSVGEAIITTSSDGRIVFMNPIAQSLTGWKEKEVLNRSLLEFIHIINEKDLVCYNPVQKVLKTQKVFTLPHCSCLLSKEGTKHAITGCCAPIRFKSDRVLGTALVFHDITGKKKKEEENIKAYKLESIKTFADRLAHDCNNILTIILGNISLAKMFTAPEHKAFKNLAEAEKTCTEATQVIQRLVNFFKDSKLTTTSQSIKELIPETVDVLVSESLDTCAYYFSDNLWPVIIDKDKIGKALTCIIRNSVESMDREGNIVIRVENKIISSDTFPFKEGRYVEVSIQDNGCGIPKEHMTKIFDPYFTTKPDRDGMGLTTSYFIMKNHKGFIDIESEPGVGTTVHLYLPAADNHRYNNHQVQKNNELILDVQVFFA